MKEHKAYFIDTNIFVRFFVREDERIFSDCARLIALVRQGDIKAYINSLVLAEVNWVLKTFYGFSKKDILSALQSIASLSCLAIDDRNNIKKAISLYETHSVKFIDAVIASHELVANWDVPVVSYDNDFNKLGVIYMNPKTIIKR